MRILIATQAQRSQGRVLRTHQRDNPARGSIGVIERLWSAETQQRHCTIDVIEGPRASETTLRTDTICVEGVAERSHVAETTPRRLCATSWSRRASQSRDTSIEHSHMEHP
jgi:hypothetical protein